MVKVIQKTARKDFPQFGIKKGEVHYAWTLYRMPTQRSLKYPTRSSLTQDSAKGDVYDGYDTFTVDAESVVDDIRSLVDTLQNSAQEFTARKENMPEGLQQGETGQNLENWADACESAASELENVASNVEDKDNEEYWDKAEDGTKTLNVDNVMEAINNTEPDLG